MLPPRPLVHTLPPLPSPEQERHDQAARDLLLILTDLFLNHLWAIADARAWPLTEVCRRCGCLCLLREPCPGCLARRKAVA
jgi:hypothetical protein